MKFRNRKKFFDTVNRWVRDGSNIVEVISAPWGDEINLIGKDGVKETLTFYFTTDDFRRDPKERGDEPKPGDQVIIENTLLYNGRVGTLEAIPRNAVTFNLASWDYLVKLEPHEDDKIEKRIIGVDRDQVRYLDPEEELEKV
jgi:hypothetical protein